MGYPFGLQAYITSGGSGGVKSVGTVGSSPAAAGASISGSVLTLQPADGTHPGLVTATAQTFGGSKTIASGSDLIVANGYMTFTAPGSGVKMSQAAYAAQAFFIFDGSTRHFVANTSATVPTTDIPVPLGARAKVTQNSTTPVAVTTGSFTTSSGDNRVIFANVGSGATQIVYNLPSAAVGLEYAFVCEDSGGVQIVLNGTDDLRYVSTAGSALLGTSGGTITTTVQGASLRMVCHKTGVWSLRSVIGTIGAAATNWVVS